MAPSISHRVISWNVKGLNTPEKQFSVLLELHRLSAHVYLIQETHFMSSRGSSFHNAEFSHSFYAFAPDTKSKGVSVLNHRAVPWQTEEVWADPTGRALFLKGKMGAQKCTFANVYAPNLSQVSFLVGILEKLDSFSEGMIVFSGDLTLV